MILNVLRRTMDARKLNEVANHPEVRAWLGGGAGAIDLSDLVSNPANVAFEGAHGGFIAHKQGDGVYEVHSLFVPEGRGEFVMEAAREAQRFMFCATDCTELRTKCPDGNAAALGLCRAGGFQHLFRREKCWPANGEMVGASYHSLNIQRWISRDDQVAEVGHWFHEKLTEAKLSDGSDRPVHDDDEAHDRYVGASVLMIKSGNPRKAVWSYNRWAVFAGYAPIKLLSDAPVIIDVVDAVVAPRGDDMEILLCR